MRAHRRVSGLQPDVAAALLRAYAIIRDNLSDAELARIIASGQLDRLFSEALTQSVMDRAFLSYRTRVRQTVEKSFRYTVPELPKGGKIDGVLAVSFDHLSENVITAIRDLDNTGVSRLQAEVRDTVRAFVENGLRDGDGPLTIARRVRGYVGLSPNMVTAIENLRTELEDGRFADAAERALLDKRFNLSKLDALSPSARAARIDTIVETYRKAFVAHHAETVSRTATLDAYKQGQALAWDQARESGVVPEGARLTKTWVGVMDDRERPSHVIMEGEAVPIDDKYSNGQDFPGQGEFNCRCVSRIRVQAA